MSTEPDWIRDALSEPRFAPYLAKTGGDLRAAIQLYWWNVGVSAAFYTPLHCLEMALRNAVHQQLAANFRRTDWWDVAPLNKGGLRLVEDARSKLATRARPTTADDMVAELSFGFWVSLVSNTYHRDLWVPCLHKAFPFHRGATASATRWPAHDAVVPQPDHASRADPPPSSRSRSCDNPPFAGLPFTGHGCAAEFI